MHNPSYEEILNNTRLGTLLVQQQQLSEIQLANALREHLISGLRLGEVLVQQGLVPRSVIDYYSIEQHRLRDLFEQRDNFHRECSQLGYLLAQTQLVDPEDIEAALAEQRRTGRQLGDILVARGLISQEILQEVLALQARFRRTACSAMLSLLASVVAVPQVNSANLTATGQIAITLRFTDRQRPVFLESPERFRRNENVDLRLDAEGQVHSLALRLEDTELRLEVMSEENRGEAGAENGSLRLDDYELEFDLQRRDGRSETMSISLSPT